MNFRIFIFISIKLLKNFQLSNISNVRLQKYLVMVAIDDSIEPAGKTSKSLGEVGSASSETLFSSSFSEFISSSSNFSAPSGKMGLPFSSISISFVSPGSTAITFLYSIFLSFSGSAFFKNIEFWLRISRYLYPLFIKNLFYL